MEVISHFQRVYQIYNCQFGLMKRVWLMRRFGSKAHTYSPAYTETDFPVIMKCSSHITFNSFNQFRHFYPEIEANEEKISCGIRINPEYSEVEVELYNPCAPGTRFGVTADLLPDTLPAGIEDFIAIAIANPVLMSWSIH